MSSSSNYHLPTIAAVAGIALAASGYVLSTSNNSTNAYELKKRRRRIKSKIQKERDGQYILGLTNSENYCFLNSILQAFATLPSLRSYLAERVDEQGDESTPTVPQNEFILQSVACALYATIEMLNRPLPKAKSITPDDFSRALERKFGAKINPDQQDAHELFQIISSVLTSEEEVQYKENAPSLLDSTVLRNLTMNDNYNGGPTASGTTTTTTDVNSDQFETSSVSSFGTTASMWSSFSVCTVGGHLRPRRRTPRNPFTGLAASKISCMNCGYTAPIRHHTFDNISLNLPSQQIPTKCALESLLKNYTKVDVLTDYQCKKCSLMATLNATEKELSSLIEEHGFSTTDERVAQLTFNIRRLKDALNSNVEASMPGIQLVTPPSPSRTTKQTMFANPPKALCLHISRSIYHPSGMIMKNHCPVEFPEYLDLAPFTTNGYLNTTEPTVSLSSPTPSASGTSLPQTIRTSRTSLVYLRNMANGYRFYHHPSISGHNNMGLKGIALMKQLNKNNNGKHHPANGVDDDRIIQSALPSLSVLPMNRSIQYRLCAVIVHYGNHHSGHFVTYRRKKLPTGHEVRSPFMSSTPKKEEPVKFWRCSDEVIEEVDLDTVLKSEAYMLFYERN
ncbi:hypothetical protein BDF20DRAFT_16386 [Mycotypha africana]|uniref:uncharacterized protein n=1 Tax=Mycotypha africana TaxID=64632 RepID=UPI0023019407|nr:uncharacterized protein BDF20DRAFT_16386 [Mycotypha africana]KAI8991012.1 hypothetical protein BDF20DRAFT_16386 [Mycotypha africana]